MLKERRILSASIVILAVSFFTTVTDAIAYSVTVAWYPNPASENVTDYHVFWGTITRTSSGFIGYGNELDAGNNTQLTFQLPDDNNVYYISVIAINDAGARSDYSSELQTRNGQQLFVPDIDVTRVKSTTLYVQWKQAYTNGQAFDLTDGPKGVQSYKFYVATTAAADVATATPTIVPKTLKTTCRKNLPAGNTVYWAYRVVFNDNTESELSPIAFWLKGYPFAAVDYTNARVDGRAAIKFGASGCFGNYYTDIDLRPELCSDTTGVDLILQPAPLCSAFDMNADGYVGPTDQISWGSQAFGQATH